MRFSLEQKSHFSPFLIIQLHGMHSTLCCIISTAVLQRNSGTQWPAAAIGSNAQQLLSTYSKNLSLTHSNPHPHPNPATPTSHTGQTSERQGGQAQFQRITEWLELEGTLKTIQLRVAKLQLTRSNCPGPHSTQPWIPPGMRHPYLLFYPPHLSGGAACTLSEGALWFHSLCHW